MLLSKEICKRCSHREMMTGMTDEWVCWCGFLKTSEGWRRLSEGLNAPAGCPYELEHMMAGQTDAE